MADIQGLNPSIYEGWHSYQEILKEAVAPLNSDQLALSASPKLRSVAELTAHIIGARAGWFYKLMGEGGDEFKALRRWSHQEASALSSEYLVNGLEATWEGMHNAIGRWSSDEWKKTWPGGGDREPKVITRQWVIWHLIEHDIHHGGEISLTLGMHGVQALSL